MSSSIRIETADVFLPLLDPARNKGAFGGRGSGKSHDRAESLIERAIMWPSEAGEGLRWLCIREVQKSLNQSAKYLLETKLAKFGLGEAHGFKVFKGVIQTPGDGLIDFQGMQDHTADTIKSYEGYHGAWAEEAQTISNYSLDLLRPTIRWENKSLGLESELWFTWNPRRKSDPVDRLFRGAHVPSDTISVNANWDDNPWFPSVLEKERQDCLHNEPEKYDHIWEGGYATVYSGAYFAKHISEAKLQNRVGKVTPDGMLSYGAFVDIGGTGAKADNFVIWICQFVGKEIRVLNHYEQQGQPIESHKNWLHENGYTQNNTTIWLPHDGDTQDKVYDVSYASAFRSAGYPVEIIPNQGRGAAKQRIEAVRRIFKDCWFNESTTDGGLQALGWYHEKQDETRQIGLGPEHDWSSHSSDAFGLMAIVYETRTTPIEISDPYKGFKRYG